MNTNDVAELGQVGLKLPEKVVEANFEFVLMSKLLDKSMTSNLSQ